MPLAFRPSGGAGSSHWRRLWPGFPPPLSSPSRSPCLLAPWCSFRATPDRAALCIPSNRRPIRSFRPSRSPKSRAAGSLSLWRSPPKPGPSKPRRPGPRLPSRRSARKRHRASLCSVRRRPPSRLLPSDLCRRRNGQSGRQRPGRRLPNGRCSPLPGPPPLSLRLVPPRPGRPG